MAKKLVTLSAVAILGLLMAPRGYARTTQEVWDHHFQAWNSHDLEAVAADYGEDSIVIVNSRLFQGVSAIRSAFQQLFSIFNHARSKFDAPVIQGPIVYLTWHVTPTGEQTSFGSDTFVIEHGEIIAQTIASAVYEDHPVSLPKAGE
jgi:hypothetical protein